MPNIFSAKKKEKENEIMTRNFVKCAVSMPITLYSYLSEKDKGGVSESTGAGFTLATKQRLMTKPKPKNFIFKKCPRANKRGELLGDFSFIIFKNKQI